MRTLQIIACPCGRIKVLGEWRWNDLEFSEIVSIIFRNYRMELGKDFLIIIHYQYCDDCKEKFYKGGDGNVS
jgi:hypothetical protein